ncbi:MAG: UPF0158 family protein, partial [Ktedonobacteraceae bacterium]
AMATLPNGNPIDMDMLEVAMEDANLINTYFLNAFTGEVVFLSEYDDPDEQERLAAEIDGNSHYVRVERIPSFQAYEWMVTFMEEVVAPQDGIAARRLSYALDGKGAFSRFKDALYHGDGRWVQAWYEWRKQRLTEAAEIWLQEAL